MTRWRNVLGACSLAMMVSACGGLPGLPGSAPPAESTAVPTVVPTVARAAASVVPSPSPSTPPARPTATTAAASVNTVWVGNTDGEGVFVRKTPVMTDRVQAYPDGTPLTVVGPDVDGDGQHWKHIKTPDGLEGYVPSIYTVDAQP